MRGPGAGEREKPTSDKPVRLIREQERRGRERSAKGYGMLADVSRPLYSAPFATIAVVLALALFPLSGCHTETAGPMNGDGQQRALARQQREMTDQVRVQLEQIPPPTKSKYMAIKTLTAWENPYLTVQDNLIVLHVTLGDANTSALGQGGMLRPTGARRQDLTIRVGELAAALNAVPQTAWPLGRVIAVEEAHNTPPRMEPAVRRTIEGVMRTLGDLGVVPYEWSEGGAGLR